MTVRLPVVTGVGVGDRLTTTRRDQRYQAAPGRTPVAP
jgi:hypothetical protein